MSGYPKVVTVLGGGAFGTAMAQLCGRKGIETRMWYENTYRVVHVLIQPLCGRLKCKPCLVLRCMI